jgi:hypothetical protein
MLFVIAKSLELDCLASSGGSDSWSGVLDLFDWNAEFSESVSEAFWRGYEVDEVFAVVDLEVLSDHFRQDGHLADVCLDWFAFAFSLAELFHELFDGHAASAHASAQLAWQHLDELVVTEFLQFFDAFAFVSELSCHFLSALFG